MKLIILATASALIALTSCTEYVPVPVPYEVTPTKTTVVKKPTAPKPTAPAPAPAMRPPESAEGFRAVEKPSTYLR